MAFFQRLIALVVLTLSGIAHASFPPVTVTEYTCGYGGYHSTFDAAVVLVPVVANGSHGEPWKENFGSCAATRLSDGALRTVATLTKRTVQQCPANSTLAGSVCNCDAGFSQEGNQCVDTQAALCSALSGQETYASASGSIAPGAASCNATGCMTNFADTLIRVKDKQGVTVTEGAATFTGAKCTYSAESGSAEDTCPSGFQGEVNGVSTCVPYDPKLNVIETTGKTESSVTEGGDTTDKTSTSSTVCSNGSCTTTTTTNTTINGGAPTSRSETRSEPQSDFCAANPRSPQCGDSSSFGGGCGGAFACTGDPVQCATARAVNEHSCRVKDVFEMDGSTQALVQSVVDGTWVVNPKDVPRELDVGEFDQTSAFSAACPGDVPFVLAGVSLSIPLSQYCAQLQLMGNILVLFTLLSATVFVFRGST